MALTAIGLSSAEGEALQSADRFLRNYVDVNGAYKAIRDQRIFYLIGPKGAGKSAIAEYTRLRSIEEDYQYFVDIATISDLPHGAVGSLMKGGGESPEYQYIRAWKYVLSIRLFQTIAREPAVTSDATILVDDLKFLLGRCGLMEAESLSDIVTRSKRKTLWARVKNIGASRETLQDMENINADTLYETLRDFLHLAKPKRQHIVFLDGLDTVFSKSASLERSISGLLQAAFDLNMEMKRRDFPYVFVVLVRDDMLARVTTPDISKHTHDFGLRLRWFSMDVQPEDTPLWSIINRRASVAAGRTVYAEVELLGGTPGGPQNPVKWIFERTRHRPRDVIMMMNEVLRLTRGDRADSRQLDNAYTRYSETCFLKEVTDELKAHLDAEGRDQAILLLRLIGQPEFSFQEARAAATSSGELPEGKVPELLRAMFECNAIGHVLRSNNRDGQRSYVFKYRNDAESFVSTRPIMVHRGLWRVLTL